VSKQCKNLAKF